MNSLFIFLVGAGIGFFVGRYFVPRGRGDGGGGGGEGSGEGEAEALDGRSTEREANLEQLRALLRTRLRKGSARTGEGRITNDEVQKLLGISDATATRYLDELEKEGLIRQVGGSRGHQVYYEKI